MERGNTPDVESDDDGDDANGDAKNGAGNVQRGDGATILKTTSNYIKYNHFNLTNSKRGFWKKTDSFPSHASSTDEEYRPCNQEVVGLNPAG